METTILHKVNAMPAPTWNRLHVNDTEVEIPQGLVPARSASVQADGSLLGNTDAFDLAMDRLQREIYGEKDENDTEEALSSPNETKEGIEQSALSSFQAISARREALQSVTAAFETGMGTEAFDYLRSAAGTPTVLATAPNQREALAAIQVNGIDGGANVVAVDVVAAPGSDITVYLDLDSPDAGTGVVGSSLRVFAGRGSQVTIVSTQTLDDTWTALDDTGMVLDAHARIEVRHTVLGAGKSFTGLAGDLRGEASQTAIDTRYLGHNQQERDFNYTLRHRGAATVSNMNANGVLAGDSGKTLRGTIDFIRGCKGASGQEAETVLIVDDHASNRTVPVILCGEDDVAGNHGATIGHVRPGQLFYLQSRGLSPEAAEELFVRATLEEAAITAPDEAALIGVTRLGKALLGEFEEVCA